MIGPMSDPMADLMKSSPTPWPSPCPKPQPWTTPWMNLWLRLSPCLRNIVISGTFRSFVLLWCFLDLVYVDLRPGKQEFRCQHLLEPFLQCHVRAPAWFLLFVVFGICWWQHWWCWRCNHRNNPRLIQRYPDFHSVPKLFKTNPGKVWDPCHSLFLVWIEI